MYHAIQIIGYGKKKIYTIVEVIKNKGTNPTDGKRYKTKEAAFESAEKQHIKIQVVGDFWEII